MKKGQIAKIINANTISTQQLREMKENGYHCAIWYVIDGKNVLIHLDIDSDADHVYIGFFRLDITPEVLADMEYDTIEEYWSEKKQYMIDDFCFGDEGYVYFNPMHWMNGI